MEKQDQPGDTKYQFLFRQVNDDETELSILVNASMSSSSVMNSRYIIGRPAQQTEKVDESLRQEAGVAVSGHAYDGTVLALGKLCAIGCDEQRQMREPRRFRSQALPQRFERRAGA